MSNLVDRSFTYPNRAKHLEVNCIPINTLRLEQK